ncbi:MAG: class I SAM-dependent methyltransferase [Methanoregula sp.]|nr:class I SAM-dependent methyltransferase [Methanoregula sp.]
MHPVPGYADPDWNESWKERQARHAASKHFEDPSHDWDKKENAERYNAGSKSEYDARVKMTIAGLDINRQSRVLDIGAGPGTLALPLAPLVHEITAIEPGTGMVDLLYENMRREKITNIMCIKKRWEDIDPARDLAGHYDVVIASLSLTMEDIRESLAKMDAVSKGYVYLFWFADPPFWERMYVDLWQPLHGECYYPGPKADCLFNVLYQLGILPNVEMLPLTKEYRFTARKELIAFFRKRFAAKTPVQRRVLDQYLAPLIRKEGNEFVISGDSTLAKLWWKKKG